MSKVKLGPIKCPSCSGQRTFFIEVDESQIREAKRYPTAIAARCPNGHAIVIFVDASFRIRDIQAAMSESDDKGALDKMSDWLGKL